MNLRKDNCKVSFIYQYPAEQRLNHTTIVDQSATKSEKGGVATIRCGYCLWGRKKLKVLLMCLLMTYQILGNGSIKALLTSFSIWYKRESHMLMAMKVCVRKKLIKIHDLATTL